MLSIPEHDGRAIGATTAIQRGDVDALQRLLCEDPNLAAARVVDGRGVSRTLLHIVADWPGHFPNGPRTVSMLVAAGADINAHVQQPAGPHPSNETAWHWAASSDDVAVIDALLDGGAGIEAPGAVFTGGTPMSDAVVFAQWRAARRLLERGATTTIWQAAALGLADRVRAFWAVEPTPTVEAITNAIWHACRGGQEPPAEYLLERGADMNWLGHDGKTPCDVAQDANAAHMVRWLRERGAKRAAELK